jgi:LPXTG-site transpeptidase (sortase) family protein
MIAVGAVLVVSTAGYLIYSAIARSQLDDLQVTVPSQDLTSTSSPSDGTLLDSNFISIYPGNSLPSVYWDDPRWADVGYDAYTSAFEGFAPLDTGVSQGATGPLSAPARLSIPAISLSSEVKTLEIIDLGDVRAWEIPKHVVGHIPETAKPGEIGNVYLFGHLQSPVKGEGSIFRKLPQIPDLLRQGEKVYLILYNEMGAAYLYQVFDTTVVHQDNFALESSSEALVTLVTCVPDWVYDSRLLVTARLVGVK